MLWLILDMLCFLVLVVFWKWVALPIALDSAASVRWRTGVAKLLYRRRTWRRSRYRDSIFVIGMWVASRAPEHFWIHFASLLELRLKLWPLNHVLYVSSLLNIISFVLTPKEFIPKRGWINANTTQLTKKLRSSELNKPFIKWDYFK